jgi:hypothetical protein
MMLSRLQVRQWIGVAILALLAWFITALVGVAAGGKDIDETCAAAGQPLDDVYRHEHWQEPGQFFPMHDRCNADYDLIPWWINPGLVVFTAVIVVCLAGAVVATARLILKRSSR